MRRACGSHVNHRAEWTWLLVLLTRACYFWAWCELFPETNKDQYRYKLQSSLTVSPSHNKREQHLGNQITRFRNAPWQWKKNCLDVKSLHFPWVYLFLLLSALFPLRFHIYLYIFFYYYPVSLSLLLYIPFISLFSPTWPLATHGPRSSQYEHPPLQSTNRVIPCFPVEFFATNPLIRNDWDWKRDDKTIKMASHSLVPLVILLVVVAIFAVVGYIAYSIVQDVTKSTREKMEERNVMFTKDGMTVGVKELKDEDYKDRSQRLVPFFFSGRAGWEKKKDRGLQLSSVLVNMWNHTSFPAYKSRLWNMTGSTDDQDGAEKRKPWVFFVPYYLMRYIY